jgi:DNA polymerase-3 subunit gamma/tau
MNKNSKVLALKYRPQTFDDLIGQEVVAETITNSIKADRIPNAYLFTGIRGVGKTTTARIVAKSLNCLNGIKNLCKDNLCENCKAITNSSHIDVLEMDAASKTGVDDVRDLIEFSRYGPTSSKFKIFIIDEVHMLSKQAFNALLKTLEEPPEYLKFIFATTEIKKIPITVVSRCQRFDLSRIKSFELFNFIKEILEKENRKASEDAIKLIVKISEGSVRDALSLLDRALISLDKNIELDLKTVQKIFGYFDKSHLIELFENVFQGNEKKVLQIYRNIYDQGIEPKIFLNDFLEILYYFKNISSLKIDGTNFTLNDTEFNSIQKISKNINNETLLLFWQFTIKTIEEIEIVSNQNIAMEMFLIRLMYLKGISNFSNILENHKNLDETNINSSHKNNTIDNKTNDSLTEIKGNTVGQIKNVIQKKNLQEPILESSEKIHLEIKTFSDLINLCNSKKEIKLKYELETNVNLVSFNDKRIEISFNEKLDKEFIKTLSSKLFDWTNDRWIISLSKEMGDLSKKEKDIILKKESLEVAKKGKVYKKVLEIFNDAELIGINIATTEVKKND